MDNAPSVSVIVPVYNGEKTIEKCILSLMDQDYPRDRYEIIVVDNGSTDGTAKIVKQFPVKYLSETSALSSYVARNIGIRNSNGEILAFTDADCTASRDWIQRGVAGFIRERVGCVAGGIKGCEPANYIEKYQFDIGWLSQEVALKHYFLPYPQTANAFYRKVVFDKTGLFEEWVSGGDSDMAWRMQLYTDYLLESIPEAVVFHKHRSTLLSFLKQTVKWGKGKDVLYKKYKNEIQKANINRRVWSQMAWFFLDAAKYLRHGKYAYAMLAMISFIGFKTGLMIGSVKNGLFYIE